MMMSSGVKEKQKELSSWQTRKRVRQTDDDDDTSLLRKEEKVVENKKVKLPGPNEGHYTIGDATYLE
eukprot:11564819-Ditylum_brightwellii.AAC.1